MIYQSPILDLYNNLKTLFVVVVNWFLLYLFVSCFSSLQPFSVPDPWEESRRLSWADPGFRGVRAARRVPYSGSRPLPMLPLPPLWMPPRGPRNPEFAAASLAPDPEPLHPLSSQSFGGGGREKETNCLGWDKEINCSLSGKKKRTEIWCNLYIKTTLRTNKWRLL